MGVGLRLGLNRVLLAGKLSNSKLNQSARVANIAVYYTIRSFKRTPGPKVG